MKHLQNFGFTHKCGILMPISSLPSPYGIGSFGREAYRFVDFLSRTGQTCWQVLPLNPTSYGDSPYQSPASVAGNPYFIDLPTLVAEGLLRPDELAYAKKDCKRVDYGWLFGTRFSLLRVAHARFEPTSAYRAFCRKNAAWLEDYALFMALKVHNGYREWTRWEPQYRNHAEAVAHAEKFEKEASFWRWTQYVFFSQWKALRAYAGKQGIRIIGDMPIYVAHDSMDVWRAPDQFLLDGDGNPTLVAGCPPDGFSPDGQLWGNPIYNWERMREDGFAWWRDRFGAAFALYDLVRIDHFRGFASYYAIPYGDTTARNGRWIGAPGKELFDAVKAAYPRARIIAEDLGFITDDVRELLAYTGFPGMKVLQFAFSSPDCEYLPRTYTTDNCLVYTASHDSDCTVSWAKGLNAYERASFKRECPRDRGQSVTNALIECAMRSRANLCVIPMQDYLELDGAEGRMNTPSRADGNWQWRLSPRYATKALTERILDMARRTKRAKSGRT